MPPIAELLTDASLGKQPKLRQGARGIWEAELTYRINCTREENAIQAENLPRFGDPYPNQAVLEAAPGLICIDRQFTYSHGTDDPITQTGGWTEAICRFTQPELGGSGVPIPSLGRSFTELSAVTSGVQVMFEARAPGQNGPADPSPIAGGRGASKDTGGFLAIVSVDRTPAQILDMISAIADLHTGQKFNLDAIQLPALLNAPASQRIAVAKETAQYHGFRDPVYLGGLVRFSHILKIIPAGPFVFEQPEDKDGRVTGEIRARRIYESAPFTGLW